MTPRAIAACRRVLLFALLLIGGLPARADTPVSVFQSFRGNVNFVGTEGTLRTKDNSKPCSLVGSGKISASLDGIPNGATIESAQLYWAGSGATADYKVTFDGVSVNAGAARQYVAKAMVNNTAYTYFSGAADVTSQVQKKGNGTYTFSGLTVDNGNPWCSVQGVVGGFALVVVYSHPNEPFRMLNLYEGFQAFQNTSLSISLGNFNVPNPLPANVTGRIGHITWEGDSTLSQGGEDLLFNGVEMTDTINPKGNQFNSASNVTGDTSSFGIDFDVYTLASPTIQPGQSTATTTYKTGQDMVLLNAEIVAMPYVANADLSLAMTRTGNLTVGSSASYTLTVSNGGVDDEIGPVTVVDTLPAGLKLVSTSGNGWTCTNVQSGGQTVVTCVQPGPLKSGVKMSALTISVSPTRPGNYTNTAMVSGRTGDDKLANNTATNSSGAVDNGSAAMLFTGRACLPGEAIVIGAGDVGCPRFIGPVIAADKTTQIYITTVGGVPQKAVSNDTADKALAIDVKASCLPYNPQVPVSYAGVVLDCSSTGGWKAASVTIAGGKASAALAFDYADVGRVSLSMRLNNSVMDAVDFISKPMDVRFINIARASDGVADVENNNGGVRTKPDVGFAKAGERFGMTLAAVMADGNAAPSFGKERAALATVFGDDTFNFKFALDPFVVNQFGPARVPFSDKGQVDKLVVDAFALDQDFTPTGTAPLTYQTTARYFEAGLLGITPRMVDYLGAGPVPEVTVRMGASTRVVGRFYPDHFETKLPEKKLACAASMNCPTADGVVVNGAAYSMQPFDFTVTAYALPRTDGGNFTALSLYQNVKADGTAPGPLRLQASKAPNLVKTGTLADAQPPATGYFAAKRGIAIDPTSLLPQATTANPFPALSGTGAASLNVTGATYQLGDLYGNGTRGAGNWGAPAPVYLRAVLPETRAGGTSGTAIAISTIAPAGAPADTQYEDGLLVVSGRLFVQNVFGSDLLRLPVPLTAQYWSGTAWLASSGDDTSAVASAIVPVTNGCRKFFAQDLKTGPCKATPLTIGGAVPIVLNKGRGTLVLQSPARGTIGSVDYTLDNGDAKDWLPSTQARATFGLYRSPVIFLREVY
jgi:uncharacterized repeat protein (TIGR01451 family)